MSTENQDFFNFPQRWDEYIFNHNNCVSPDYRGGRWMLLVPLIVGIAAGGYFFFFDGFAVITKAEYHLLKYLVLIAWFLNQLIYIKHVFILPGFFRKFFYPVFVSLITVPILLLSFYCVYVVLFLACIIFVLSLVGSAASGDSSERRKSSSQDDNSVPIPSSSPTSEPPKKEYAYLDDGTPFGTRIEKNGSTWSGGFGDTYEKNWDGTFSKKG
jgi:hypothetical protein